MGFYPQPNDWQCGPFALKHALVMLGILVEEKQISKLAGTNWWYGTDEIQLGRAARQFQCELKLIRRFDPEEARRELIAHLRHGYPTLLCMYEWSHWVTVVKAERGKFILMDSRDKAVLTILSWKELKRHWVYHEEDELDRRAIQTIYDFHPVVPHFRVQTKAKFSLARANYLRRPTNRTFSRLWDVYLADLLNLCKPRTSRSTNVISLGEFMRRYENMILDQVDLWHGWIVRSQGKRILNYIHFVADTYGLVIHDADEKRALAGITAIMTLWAASEYGVSSVYQPVKRKSRR
ncbi:MAG: hypothetical protein A2059_00085 [Ignavibacteria bacterium GWA2_55_25]|nr:MAG: hypothetical protein A2059_00085 [Ignavibacteria bacterium GWA2_55_25]